MRKGFGVLLFLVGCCAALGAADDKLVLESPGASVYQINPWVDYPVLAVAAAGAAVPPFFKNDIVHKTDPGNPDDVNSFDRPVIGNHSLAAAWASHVTVGLAIATPIYLDVKDVGWSKPLFEDFVVYSEVLSIDSSLTNLVGYSVQRPRPEAYSEHPPPTDGGSYLSFYSGHVASTMAALSAASMTYGYRYGFKLWPWVVTGTAGLTESALRSAAGKHFYTDDIVGLLAGTAVGTLVPMWHHRRGPPTVTLVPDDHGAQLVWHKNF